MPNESWQAEQKKLRTMWVVVIMMFWFSVTFQGAIFLLEGTLNLILMSIILGMLVLGIALKMKLQRHEASKGRPDADK
ncbi:MAG: hypothetical protein KDI68_10740 [Gammaproteobacteria bacterium]|nr:hypothetical protein [Gammaproteobacteria bacterium]